MSSGGCGWHVLLIAVGLQVSVGPYVEAQRLEVTAEQVAQLETLADAYHAAGLFDGAVLIAHRGRILFEQAYGMADPDAARPNTLDTRFALASITKQFTAAAVMLLVEEGVVRLEAPIGTYLLELRPEIGDAVTVHQLLRHTSCLPEETAYMLEARSARRVSQDSLLRLIDAQDPVLPAGTQFSYNNVGYVLLAMMVEAASGQDFATFLDQRLFTPLGMVNTGFRTTLAASGYDAVRYERILGVVKRPVVVHDSWLRGAGGLYSTAHDLLAWDQALYDPSVLSAESVERMYRRGEHAAYGYGWRLQSYWVEGDERAIAYHTGSGPGVRSAIRRYLDDRFLVVVLSNQRHAQVDRLSLQLGGILLGAPAPSPPRPFLEHELLEVLFSDGVAAAAQFYETADASEEWWMPRSASLNRMGYQFLRAGRVEESREIFRLAVALYPGLANAYDSFAESHLVAGDRDSAVMYYRKAVDLDLGKVNALFMLNRLGDVAPGRITDPVLRVVLDEGVDPAVRAYRARGSMAPHEFYVNAAGYNLLRHGRATDAVPIFELNAAVHPASANTWDSLGEAYMTVGRREDAIQSYRRSLQLDPENRNAVLMLERLEAPGSR
jgi:CubicO group peptidase (beta-lactamase class C family)